MREKLEWLKEHKEEILIGTGVLVSTTLLIVVGVKSHKAMKLRPLLQQRFFYAAGKLSDPLHTRSPAVPDKIQYPKAVRI